MTEWISAILTAYPHRMTNKVRGEITKKKDKLIGFECPSFKRKYLRTSGKKILKLM